VADRVLLSPVVPQADHNPGPRSDPAHTAGSWAGPRCLVVTQGEDSARDLLSSDTARKVQQARHRQESPRSAWNYSSLKAGGLGCESKYYLRRVSRSCGVIRALTAWLDGFGSPREVWSRR
jgi:hypothetical protein